MRRLRAVGAHLSATSASDDELLFMRFPHCGEVRQVHPIPQELLDRSLGPGHGTVTVGDRMGGAFALRGPSVVAETEEEQPPPEAAPDAPLRVDGPLALQPPATGEAVGDLARRREDDGLRYLPGALTPEQVASLIQAMDAAKTDPGNPVDSGIGTLAANRAIAAAEAAGEAPDWNWTGNKGVMSWWNRFPDGQMLQYLDLDPCCAVAEATLGADCHLIQQKGYDGARPARRSAAAPGFPTALLPGGAGGPSGGAAAGADRAHHRALLPGRHRHGPRPHALRAGQSSLGSGAEGGRAQLARQGRAGGAGQRRGLPDVSERRLARLHPELDGRPHPSHHAGALLLIAAVAQSRLGLPAPLQRGRLAQQPRRRRWPVGIARSEPRVGASD